MSKRKILWPIFSFIIFLALILTITSYLFTKSNLVKQKVEQTFKNLVETNFRVKVKVGKIEGNILTGFILNDIKIFSYDSLEIGNADFLSIEYNLFSLITRKKIIKRILIQKPSLNLSKISPSSLVKKKENNHIKKSKERDKAQVFAIRDIVISKGNILFRRDNKNLYIEDINTNGAIYLSPTKNTIFLKKFSSKIKGITNINTFSGTIIFKNHIVLLLNCLLKTSHSFINFNGNLFDENKGLSIKVKYISLNEISHLFFDKNIPISGRLRGNFDIKGKKQTLTAKCKLFGNNLIYNGDSLGNVILELALKNYRLNIKQLLWTSTYGKLNLTGHYNLQNSSFKLSANTEEFIPDRLLYLFTQKEIKAKINGETDIAGEYITHKRKRKIEINAHLVSGYIKDLDFDSLNTVLSYKKGNLQLTYLNLYKKNSWLRLDHKEENTFLVKTKHFNIAPLLSLINIKDVEGLVTLNATYKKSKGKHLIKAKISCLSPRYKEIKAHLLSGVFNYNTPGENSKLLLKDVEIYKRHLDSLTITTTSDTVIRTIRCFLEGKNILFRTVIHTLWKNNLTQLKIDTLNLHFKEADIRNKKNIILNIVDGNAKMEKTTLFIEDIPVSITGNLTKSWHYSINIKGNSLDLREIGNLFRFNKNLGGNLTFEINGNGTLQDPKITLNLKVENFFLQQMHADIVSGQFLYHKDQIDVLSFNILEGDETSELTGSFPITIFKKNKDETKRISFKVTARNLGNWVFYPFDKFCHYEGGKVYGEVKGNGTVGKINMKGDLRLYATNLYIPFLGIRMRNTEGYLALTKEKISIKKLKASVGDGFINTKGKLVLKGIQPDSIDLEIKGEDIPITGFRDLYLIVNPNLLLKGPFQRPFLSGYIKVERGDITIPFRTKREKGIRKGDLSYDLEVSAEEGNIWLKNEDVDVELTGKVFAKGTGNVPQLSGIFQTKRGFIYYLDHTFSINRGNFKFTNAPELNPEIDLEAETTVHYSYTPHNETRTKDTTAMVYLNVEGTMQEPKFSLTSSDPSLTEENIILLLSLNVTSLEDLTSLENVSSLSDKAASFWIRQTLLREFQTSLGIDAIDLETKFIGPEKTAKLTVGKYISKDLYLGVTHNVFASSKDEFEIEYKLFRRSYIIGGRDEEGRYNIGVKFKFKY